MIEELYSLQHSGCSKADWKAGTVWLTASDGPNLNSETNMSNEIKHMAVILTTNIIKSYSKHFFDFKTDLEWCELNC